ncbi:MAG: tRNA-dihydrouridine synthase [Gammaproteobacteria bacterium]|nr:tRNA-dihydrouridine synthase [Gammaproteobacteria bacterium]
MMDWTDRHCRYFHRLFAPSALLYTEMIVSAAIVRGHAARLLEHHPREHPMALQLGGCDPVELAQAARIGAEAGYDEINLNVGCPSDRVKSGAFGACLMLSPSLVAECVRSMREAVEVPVTVKCRIGIDDQDSYEFFMEFVDQVVAAGVDALIVHARAAILGGLASNAQALPGQPTRGLTPKENREIPPLKYDYVHRLKAARPALPVVINGGFTELPSIVALAGGGLDGVMLGRAAYHNPVLLAEVERAVINPAWRIPQPAEIIDDMVSYARREAAVGVRLHSITRHMHGLMAGREGARAWRRFLSEVAARPGALPETLYSALPVLNTGLAA